MTTLAYFIPHVVCVSPEKKMLRINALSIVTSMTNHETFCWPYVQTILNSVDQPAFTEDGYFSISR